MRQEVDTETNCDNNESSYAIFYTAERFEKKLDLNKGLTAHERRDWHFVINSQRINYDPAKHQIVGFYIDCVPYENSEREYLTFSTVVVDEENREHIVDTADFHSTAMGTTEFNLTRQNALRASGNRGLRACRVRIGSSGFRREEIAYLCKGYQQAFINAHDLKVIIGSADYIAISGAQISIEHREEMNDYGMVQRSEGGPYFTWQIKGLQLPKGQDLEAANSRLLQSLKVNKFPFDKLNDISKISDVPLDELKSHERFEDNIVPLLFVSDIVMNQKSREESSISDRDPPNGSFASPCPPRWDK